MMTNIDLLYPGDEYKNYTLDEFSFIGELDLYAILGFNNSFDLTQYFTKSKEVIEYRNDILSDFIKNDCLSNVGEIIKLLESIKETRESRKYTSEITTMLYIVFEIETYIALVEYLNDFLNRHEFASTALSDLKAYAADISAGENYINLKENLKNFRMTVDNIKSITIGINLDENNDLKPYEAGIISINSTKYRSGNLLDRLLSLDTKDDGFRCLGPFSPVRGDAAERHIVMAFHNSLDKILQSNVKSWQPLVKKYIAENTDYFMGMEQGLRFYAVLMKYHNNCKNNKLPIVRPNIVPGGGDVSCKDIYHLQIALYSEELVYNDITFDENGKIYILTGPNRGGKSVFLKAIGVNQALFQLGGYVSARKADLKISQNILIYLTKNNEKSIGYGHLGEECSAVSDLLKYAGEDCLFLFDEAFSSTSASDQCHIVCEVLRALAKLRCYGLFITHNHDIYDKLSEIAPNGGDFKFDSLSALMSENESAARSYKIVRKAPDKNSFALDIAKKYNLQYDDIIKEAKNDVCI
jgi:DNA mismatch repair ATPase MutS